jgi:hypothetical protein
MVAEMVHSEPIEEMNARAWQAFREALLLKRETIETNVKTLADRFRHGNFTDTSWEQRKAALALTWSIIERALHFLHDGQGLSSEAFEML